MEKLIELLNEWYLERYGVNPHFVRFQDFGGNDYGYFRSPDNKRLMVETEVWTKKYGFIKWLVENDKIDTDAYKTVYSGDLDKRKTLTMSSGGDEFYQVTEHGVYESLLMLLSISDTPIEDLINYLK